MSTSSLILVRPRSKKTKIKQSKNYQKKKKEEKNAHQISEGNRNRSHPGESQDKHSERRASDLGLQ